MLRLLINIAAYFYDCYDSLLYSVVLSYLCSLLCSDGRPICLPFRTWEEPVVAYPWVGFVSPFSWSLFICHTSLTSLIWLLYVIGVATTLLLICYLYIDWPVFASNLGKLCVTWLRTSLINYLT